MMDNNVKVTNEKTEACVKEDMINHPYHHTVGGIEFIDYFKAKFGTNAVIDFSLGNTVKYLSRCLHKGKMLEDLKKAQWYLNYAINQLEPKEDGDAIQGEPFNQ